MASPHHDNYVIHGSLRKALPDAWPVMGRQPAQHDRRPCPQLAYASKDEAHDTRDPEFQLKTFDEKRRVLQLTYLRDSGKHDSPF